MTVEAISFFIGLSLLQRVFPLDLFTIHLATTYCISPNWVNPRVNFMPSAVHPHAPLERLLLARRLAGLCVPPVTQVGAEPPRCRAQEIQLPAPPPPEMFYWHLRSCMHMKKPAKKWRANPDAGVVLVEWCIGPPMPANRHLRNGPRRLDFPIGSCIQAGPKKSLHDISVEDRHRTHVSDCSYETCFAVDVSFICGLLNGSGRA